MIRRNRRRSTRERHGFALLLVLWLIVVLGTVSAAVVLGTRETSALGGNARARVVARYAAESGVAVAAAELEARLAVLTDTAARQAYLNDLDAALASRREVTLGNAVFSMTLVDVSARVDVNNADEEGLARLLGMFGDPSVGAATARAVRMFIERRTVTAVMGGQSISGASGPAVRPLRSLDELEDVPGVDLSVLRAAAPYLTVDGDGNINRATASDTVLAAAGGSLQDEPSRLLVVSRGWMRGHTLTHEIQAVYAIAGTRLTLVRWRERDL